MPVKVSMISLLLGFALSGCGLILGWVFRPCDVEINQRYIKASCGLTNGVYFEEIMPDSLGADGLPVSYQITSRFDCYNPGVEGVQTYWPDKLYFDRQNEHYRWSMDSVNRFAVRKGNSREIYKIDEVSMDTVLVNALYHVNSARGFTTCPVAFKSNTWYFVSVMDPSLTGIYVYVSDQMRFKVYEIESGVSPI